MVGKAARSSQRSRKAVCSPVTPARHFKQAQQALKAWTAVHDTDARFLHSLDACIASLQAQLGLIPPAGARSATRQPGSNGGADADASDAVQASSMVVKQQQAYSELTRHNLDLNFEDDPAFLLAASHLELGRWHERRGEVHAALEELKAALSLFPDFIACRLAISQVLKSLASSDQDMADVESNLLAAITASERLKGADDGLLVSIPACKKELDALRTVRSELAMLLCQAGRDGEAASQLCLLGFTQRLARHVLHYPLTLYRIRDAGADCSVSGCDATATSASTYLAAEDGVLPAALLSQLRTAFRPGSPFWSQHSYGRVGYFSYMWDLKSGGPASSLAQAAQLVHAAMCRRFPAAASAAHVEFWAHCRRHSAGHQLHYDSDDEGVGGIRNPIVSSVLYLTSDVGGPTLVTDQLLGGSMAQRGWLVAPQANRVAMFDGRYLHGVLPGRGPSPPDSDAVCGAFRITLMFAFWKEGQLPSRPCPLESPGPSRPWPGQGGGKSGSSRYTWPVLLPACEAGVHGWGTSLPTPVLPSPVQGPVWEAVKAGGPAQSSGYDECFQGF